MGRPRNPNKKFKSSINGAELLLDQNGHIVAGDAEVPGPATRTPDLDKDGVEYRPCNVENPFAEECPVVQGGKEILVTEEGLIESLPISPAKLFYEAVKEVPMPKLDLYEIRNMFIPPKCKTQHAYTLMKVCRVLEDLAVQLFFSCPHNVHLQQALLEMLLVQEACNKAIQSE